MGCFWVLLVLMEHHSPPAGPWTSPPWTWLPPYTPPPTPTWDSLTHKTKVLHLSDLHVQLNYSVGSPSECHYPVCCTPGLPSHPPSPPARFWGEYACDLPPWTLEASLANIAQTHPDILYVIVTGKVYFKT